MRKGCGRSRVGQVVSWNVDSLEGRDRTFLGGGNSFLQRTHLGRKRRLVTDGAGGAAEQGRHLGASLRKTENVVDEEQHILVFFVAKIFGDGEAGESHAQASARRLIHLSVN